MSVEAAEFISILIFPIAVFLGALLYSSTHKKDKES